MIDPNYWFMFPVGILISSVAMLAGIGGALFFVIIFVSFLALDPMLAFGAGLIVELFGFGSGLLGYLRLKSINFGIVKKLILFTLPGTIVGVIFGRFVSEPVLKMLLVILLFYLSYQFLYQKKEPLPKHHKFTGSHSFHREHRITKKIRSSSFFGGMLLGMISAGLGEINEYNFLKKLQLPVASASGTSIFLVAISALIGVAIHIFLLIGESKVFLFPVILSILLFTIPGVIIGAQIGAQFSTKVNSKNMGTFLGLLFLSLGIISMIFFI